MAKDRLALTKELAEEREKGMKLTEMVKYMKEQADIYEVQFKLGINLYICFIPE